MNNPRSDAFTPATPPAPPESGFAEIVGGSIYADSQNVDDLMEEYSVAMLADEDELDLTIPTVVKPVDAVDAVDIEDAGLASGAASAEERKRAKRFHADTPFVMGLLLLLVAGMAGASFYVSFSGLFAAAAWAVGDNPSLQFAVPIMLDIAIIAFTLSLFVQRERGERVWGTWLAIGAFATVSATANILHTLVVSTATDNYQLLIGAVISGGAPVLLAFATDSVAIKVFRKA